MEISYSHNFIYIHVGKTGGSNIARALEPYTHDARGYLWNRFWWRLGVHVNYIGPKQWRYFRRHATALTGRRYLPASFYDQAFKFAFVRNPWDWMVSLYNYLLLTPSHRHHAKIKAMSGFAEYVQFEITQNKRFQHPFVTDRSGRLIVDCLGRFENLHSDFDQICRHLGIESKIPSIKVSPKRDYRSYYTHETRELVSRHFHRDIELLGYHFDPEPVEAMWINRPEDQSIPATSGSAA